MSTDDRTDIPTLRRAVKDVAREATNETKFHPGDFQKRVKARFYRRLGELSHHFDKEAAFKNPQVLSDLAGTDRILKWLESPSFARWFLDEEYVVDSIHSEQQGAIDVIRDVMYDSDASEADRLKAAKMMLELGDQFPGRKSEVKFIDDRLNALPESQVDSEIKKLEAELGGGSDGDG